MNQSFHHRYVRPSYRQALSRHLDATSVLTSTTWHSREKELLLTMMNSIFIIIHKTINKPKIISTVRNLIALPNKAQPSRRLEERFLPIMAFLYTKDRCNKICSLPLSTSHRSSVSQIIQQMSLSYLVIFFERLATGASSSSSTQQHGIFVSLRLLLPVSHHVWHRRPPS